MSVTRDNIAGFMLGISVGVGIGFILKPFQSDSQIAGTKNPLDTTILRKRVRLPDSEYVDEPRQPIL